VSTYKFGDNRVAYIVLAIGIVFTLLGFLQKAPFSKSAEEYAREITISSAVTYASLRGINAAISFAEEVEIGGSVIAVSGSAHPFKFLEPLDDAVERVASAIFLVGVASGVLTVILPILGSVAFVFMGVSAVLYSCLYLSGLNFPGRQMLSEIIDRMFHLGGSCILVVIAFSISSMFADQISERAWTDYQDLLSEVGQEMEVFSDDELAIVGKASTSGLGADSTITTGSVGSVIDGIFSWRPGSPKVYDRIKTIVVILGDKSDELIKAFIAVFAAFIFKTAVLPLLILFGLSKLSGGFGTFSEAGPLKRIFPSVNRIGSAGGNTEN